MKKSMFVVTIFLITFATVILAHNNVDNNVQNINDKWGKVKSEDQNEVGGLLTKGYIEVDIDYPGESRWMWKYGIDYEAYAKVKASFKWGTWGTYDIKCIVPNDIEPDADRYDVWVSTYERAKHFDRKRGADANRLKAYTADDVRRHLRKCSSSSEISRFRPAAGSTSDSYYYGEWHSSMSVSLD